MRVASKKLTPANFRARLKRLLPPVRFENRTQHQHFALAVSGGADSLSLLVLAAKAKTDTLSFTVLTFDHKLRATSSAEADAVCQIAKNFDLPSKKLTWDSPKPKASLQSAAREARYDAMLAWCAAHGADGLIVAHHLEDQAETFLLRLARGSGLDGLTAMRAVTHRGNGVLVRPFLDVSQADLHKVLKGQGVTPVEDPSNADPRFQRIAFRQSRDVFEALGLTSERLADTAKRLQKARDVLDTLADDSFAKLIKRKPSGLIFLDRKAFQALPEDIGMRVLRRVLAFYRPFPPRQSAVDRLYQFIIAGQTGRKTGRKTMAGQIVSVKKSEVQVFRELADIDQTRQAAPKGRTVVWDARFKVKISKKIAGHYVITPLGEKGLKWVRDKGIPLPKEPAIALQGLACVRPVLENKKLGKPIAIAGILTHSGVIIDLLPLKTENID